MVGIQEHEGRKILKQFISRNKLKIGINQSHFFYDYLIDISAKDPNVLKLLNSFKQQKDEGSLYKMDQPQLITYLRGVISSHKILWQLFRLSVYDVFHKEGLSVFDDYSQKYPLFATFDDDNTFWNRYCKYIVEHSDDKLKEPVVKSSLRKVFNAILDAIENSGAHLKEKVNIQTMPQVQLKERLEYPYADIFRLFNPNYTDEELEEQELSPLEYALPEYVETNDGMLTRFRPEEFNLAYLKDFIARAVANDRPSNYDPVTKLYTKLKEIIAALKEIEDELKKNTWWRRNTKVGLTAKPEAEVVRTPWGPRKVNVAEVKEKQKDSPKNVWGVKKKKAQEEAPSGKRTPWGWRSSDEAEGEAPAKSSGGAKKSVWGPRTVNMEKGEEDRSVWSARRRVSDKASWGPKKINVDLPDFSSASNRSIWGRRKEESDIPTLSRNDQKKRWGFGTRTLEERREMLWKRYSQKHDQVVWFVRGCLQALDVEMLAEWKKAAAKIRASRVFYDTLKQNTGGLAQAGAFFRAVIVQRALESIEERFIRLIHDLQNEAVVKDFDKYAYSVTPDVNKIVFSVNMPIKSHGTFLKIVRRLNKLNPALEDEIIRNPSVTKPLAANLVKYIHEDPKRAKSIISDNLFVRRIGEILRLDFHYKTLLCKNSTFFDLVFENDENPQFVEYLSMLAQAPPRAKKHFITNPALYKTIWLMSGKGKAPDIAKRLAIQPYHLRYIERHIREGDMLMELLRKLGTFDPNRRQGPPEPTNMPDD